MARNTSDSPDRFIRLATAVKDAVQRAQIDWSDAESGLPMVGVDLNDWTRIVRIATDADEPGPVQLSGGANDV